MTSTALSGIVPRWEWRTFGERLVTAEGRLAAVAPEQVQESDDLYLVARNGDDTAVKVRGGLVDVKRLVSTGESGLEQWVPVMKEPFPLPAASVGRVLSSLHVRSIALARPDYALEELLELVRASGEIVPVEVSKRRARYRIGGCMAEVTEARTDRGTAWTIAVESEDPARVVAAAAELGLGPLPNVSYPRWLRMLIGFVEARFCVIDVGTNSVKFHIGERATDRSWRTVVDRAEVTRLGEGLDQTGGLQKEPMERTADAVAAMVDEAQRSGAIAIAAVGTAGLRIADNSAAFLDAVEDRAGIRVEIIPGEEEGRLAYVAVKSSLGLADCALVVFDSGGGSSQFTFGHGDRVDERFSVDVGAARFTAQFGLDRPVSEQVLADALEAIGVDLGRLDGRASPDALVGMGGAMTNIAAVRHALATYDPAIVQGTVIDAGEIDRQIELYRTTTAGERRQIAGLQPKRGEVILAGACIVRTVMRKLGAATVTVSDRGVRHGLIAERFAISGSTRAAAD